MSRSTLTPAGYEVGNADSVDGLAELMRQISGHPDTSGFRRAIEADARALAARLRQRHASDPAVLARIDQLIA